MKDNYYFGGQVRNAVRPDYHGQVHNKPEPQKIDPGYYWAIPVWDFTPTPIWVSRGGRVDVLGYDMDCDLEEFQILEKIQPPTNAPTPDEITKRRGLE